MQIFEHTGRWTTITIGYSYIDGQGRCCTGRGDMFTLTTARLNANKLPQSHNSFSAGRGSGHSARGTRGESYFGDVA